MCKWQKEDVGNTLSDNVVELLAMNDRGGQACIRDGLRVVPWRLFAPVMQKWPVPDALPLVYYLGSAKNRLLHCAVYVSTATRNRPFIFIDRAWFKQYIYPFFFRILINRIKKKRYERWAVWKSVYFLVEITRLLVSLFLWSDEGIIPASSDISMISVTRRYLRYLPVFLLLFSLFFLDKGSSLPPSSSRGILNNERSLYWSQFTQLLPIKVNRDCYLLNNPVSGSKCNANIRRIPAAIIGDRFRNNRSFRINFCSDIALIRSNTFPGIEYTRREISSPSAFHFRWILTTRSKQIEGEISRYFRKIAILDCWPRDWQKKKIKKDVHIKNYYNRSGQ